MAQTTNNHWELPLSREQNLELFLAQKLAEIDAALGNAALAALTYTPTVTTGSGSLTSYTATGKYKQVGKLLFLRVTVSITNNGTGATNIRITLPPGFVAVSDVNQEMNGKETAVAGKALTAIIQPNTSLLLVSNYDNTYPAVSGYTLLLEGWLDIQ